MKINLEYFLAKKRISLVKFCETNNLHSYESLIEYCDNKKFIPVSQDEYKLSFPDSKKEIVKKDEPSKTKTRRRGRKPKAEKSRITNKKSNS